MWDKYIKDKNCRDKKTRCKLPRRGENRWLWDSQWIQVPRCTNWQLSHDVRTYHAVEKESCKTNWADIQILAQGKLNWNKAPTLQKLHQTAYWLFDRNIVTREDKQEIRERSLASILQEVEDNSLVSNND
jgi:hypothetical protein